MAAQVWDEILPPDYSCSVTSDGRIFFINEATKQSSWLHPVTKVSVQTGHRPLADLPLGWERGVTTDGLIYYIDHINQQTSLVHPVTGLSDVQAEAVHSPSPDSPRFDGQVPYSNNANGFHHDSKRQTYYNSKRSSLGSWVKGPFLRRPDEASTTLQGYLLKQGSDGLHLWKRRWFVLSDYCLYYYKNAHDDKVLGYIPLPSFKIRPVNPEDRVHKRFAFKAEHENTRTYYFAADNKEQMTQWMNALSLASIMQKDTSFEDKSNRNCNITRRSDRPSLSSLPSSVSPASPSADDSDSGFHGYQSRRFLHGSKSPVVFENNIHRINETPAPPVDARSIDEVSESSRFTNDRLNTSVDSCQQAYRPGSRQPFYANAPPKPRRLNSSYECNSTPDRSPERERREFPLEQGPLQQYQIHEKPEEVQLRRSDIKKNQYYPSSTERRTPEAYGATSTSKGDYEDVYGGNYDSSLRQNNSSNHIRLRDSFASSKSGGTFFEDLHQNSQIRNDSLPRDWQQIHRKPAGPPRPHSADFLEYDRKHGPSDMFSTKTGRGGDVLVTHQEVRPKSSVGYYHDGDLWSEENYATKMRESTIYKSYLQYGSRYPEHSTSRGTPTNFNTNVYPPTHTPQHPVGQRIPPAGAATPDLYMPQTVAASQKSPNSTIYSANSSLKRDIESRFDDKDNLSEGRFPHHLSNNHSVGNNNMFLRSASARLSRSKTGEDSHNSSFQDEGSEGEKKMQQREESMKRLLEWKQRMLQSPLTRKSSSRPDSSASSTSSNKITSLSANYNTSPSQFDSETYRQQVLQELASQELRSRLQTEGRLTTNTPNPPEEISNSRMQGHSYGIESISSKWQGLPEKYPTENNYNVKSNSDEYTKSTDGYPVDKNSSLKRIHGTERDKNNVLQQHQQHNQQQQQHSTDKNPQGERPNPQGISLESHDFSGVNLGSSRRREGKRELARTRHISGSDSKRSASSSSRYNSYSSDEQDIIEERNTRRKTRRNSRRNNSEQKENRKQVSNSSKLKNNSPSKISAVENTKKSNDKTVNSDTSHDYVNINSLNDSEQNLREASPTSCVKESSTYAGNQRAVPVFIEDHCDLTPENENKKSVYSDKFYASRDPYYVSDVQMPASTEVKLEGNSSGKMAQSMEKKYNANLEHEYENTFVRQKLNSEAESRLDKVIHNISSSKHTNPGHSNSSSEFHDHFQVDQIQSNYYQRALFQDDNSVGKYSDSGYDTLRAEISQKEDKNSPKVLGRNQNPTKKIPKRPETWSPDKFDKSWSQFDSGARVEESEIVKEYSYEYIKPDNTDTLQGDMKEMSIHSKLSAPDLPSLSSPKIVQETQHATNRNLVKDRIKCFSSITEQNKPLEKMFADVDLADGQNKNMPNLDNSQTETLINPLRPIIPGSRSSEAHVSNIKENFVSSLSTKIHTQEAQVKVLAENQLYGIGTFNSKNSPCNSVNSCSEMSSLEYKDVKSPQEIMDSRLNRSNIRKFVFEDDSTTNEQFNKNENIEATHPDTSKEKNSVKELLKSFESKSSGYHSKFNIKDCKRKFHSDSELLSNESSSDESYSEHQIVSDQLPPPPPSFLKELREEAKKTPNEVNDTPPPRPPKKLDFENEVECKGRPRSIRLSLAESIEESLRLKSESENEENTWYGLPSNEFGYNPDLKNLTKGNRSLVDTIENDNTLIIDIDSPPKEHAPPPPKLTHESLPKESCIEENYLPMSPPKKPGKNFPGIANSSSNSSLSSKHLPTPEPLYPDHFGRTEFEEHTYIEMTGEPSPKSVYPNKYSLELPKLDVGKLGNEVTMSPESPRYYEIGEKETQHYEYIYKTGPQYEAIYMEVPNLGKDSSKNKEEKPKPPLKPSDLKHLKPFHKKCSSDSALPSSSKSKHKSSDGSSDADDEASKDFESIEPPRKPRFSLSDTFRPASYYLSGSGVSTDLDAHDSSDSDLVSPPPIPFNSPPVEETDPNESLRSKTLSVLDASMSLPTSSHNISATSNTSQLIGLSNDTDFKRTPHHSYHKRSDSGSSLLSNKIKRRPLLEETLDEYNDDDDSFILRSEDVYPTSVPYPQDNNSVSPNKSWSKRSSLKGDSDISLLPEEKSDSKLRTSSSIGFNMSFHGRNDSTVSLQPHDVQDEIIYENSRLQHSISSNSIASPYINSSNTKTNTIGKSSPSLDLKRSFAKSPETLATNNSFINIAHNVSFDRENTLSPISRNVSTPENTNHQETNVDSSNIRTLASPISVSSINTPAHVRACSNLSMSSETSPRTAPYYYSDVIRDENVPFPDESTPISRARSYQLNNQRELEGSKRQDIGRKVNQIATNSRTMESKYRERLNNELKHSFEIFDGKTISVPDERNVYEADTLRKMKLRTRTPDPSYNHNSKNIYPYGISLKMDDSDDFNVSAHRRTRSLEGLVEDCTPRQRKPIREELIRNEFDLSVSNGNAASSSHATAESSRTPQPFPCPENRSSSSPSYQNNSTNSVTQAHIYSNSSVSEARTPDYNSRTPQLQVYSSNSYPVPQSPTFPVENQYRAASEIGHLNGNNDSFQSYSHNYSQDRCETRDGTTSRLSIHDTFSVTSGEANNWEDDCQWKEQLRRASLRHTKSLEALDDSRIQNVSNNSTNSETSRPQLKLSLPNTNGFANSRARSSQRSLDEYHVDYREGRIPPTSQYLPNGTVDRTRNGLTSVEEYEWDANEEKFKKPSTIVENSHKHSTSKCGSLNNQHFLAEGLPPSSGKATEQEALCNSPHLTSKEESSLQSLTVKENYADGGELGVSSGIGGRPQELVDETVQIDMKNGDKDSSVTCSEPKERQKQVTFPGISPVNDETGEHGSSVPDIIPEEDVSKLGETFHRRSDYGNRKVSSKYSQGESPLSSYSHGFGNEYQHSYRNTSTANPTSAATTTQPYNPMHPLPYNHYYNTPYKNNDFDKYSNTFYFNQSPQNHQYSYSTYDREYQGQPYQNYRGPYNYNGYSSANNSLERNKPSPYNRPVNHPPYYDPYGTYSGRSSDYYDYAFRETERLREEERLLRQEADYISTYPEAELAEAKRRGRDELGVRTTLGRAPHHPLHNPNSHLYYKSPYNSSIPTTQFNNHYYHFRRRRRHPDILQSTPTSHFNRLPSQPSPLTSATRPPPHEDSLVSSRNFLAGVSAGELLGKTHEELVLLLIQLRRHQSALLAARRHTAIERDSQARLTQLDTDRADEHLGRVSYLNEHLDNLDKQYQMGKPLINLVDNMVKLGSLYRGFDSRAGRSQVDSRMLQQQSPRQESLEFSRRILEKRILAEDQREYDSVTPDQIDLEDKVMQLYKLEKRLQTESLTIQGLQKDKDMLERALEELHSHPYGASESIMELEKRNRKRDYLEKELSRLRSHLAVSARRLEETATENSRLEHEMMMLRQKIQSNMARNAQRESEGSSEAKHIESEMLRVQSLLEDLQKRRLELSDQIQMLTSTNTERTSPVGIPHSTASFITRKKNTTWFETDLDTLVTRDRGCDPPDHNRIRQRDPYTINRYANRELSDFAKEYVSGETKYSAPSPSVDYHQRSRSPKLYSDNQYRTLMPEDALPELTLSQTNLTEDLERREYETYKVSSERLRQRDIIRTPMMDRDSLDNKPDGEEQKSSPLNVDINEADDRMKRYYGILPKEKFLEPKTVRIVKRESTERKKERFPPGKKSSAGDSSSPLSYVAEDEMESDHSDIENEPPPIPSHTSRSMSLPRNYGRTGPPERRTMMASMIHGSNSSEVASSLMRPSNLPLRSKPSGWKSRSDSQGDKPMSAHEQLFGIRRTDAAAISDHTPPSSPSKSDPPSPVFKSAAAREIVKEIGWETARHRRAVPKEKRRHFTISSSKPLSLETGSGLEEGARSRDDCDMVRALRPRNHPDVVKSTLSTRDLRFNESTIDTILGAPRKIYIPERYMPDEDDEKELTEEEKRHRAEKALAIRKMLTESSATVTKSDNVDETVNQVAEESSAKGKIEAEKREREHILAMNQILAKQVMEKSRIVAAHIADTE